MIMTNQTILTIQTNMQRDWHKKGILVLINNC